MNSNVPGVQILNNSSNFNNNILNPFLVKSKSEYSNSIIMSNSDMLNIVLLKDFPKHRYSFEYEDAINAIGKFLNRILPKYDLNDISFHENSEFGFNPSFKIKVPYSISSEQLQEYWEDIFESVNNFADKNGIDFILDDLSIILCR